MRQETKDLSIYDLLTVVYADETDNSEDDEDEEENPEDDNSGDEGDEKEPEAKKKQKSSKSSDNTINNPEVRRLVESARTEERNKLQGEMTKVKKDKETLSRKVGELTTQLENSTEEVATLKAQATLSTDEKVIELQKEVDKLKGENTSLQSELDAKELEEVRRSIIDEADGEIIEEMVEGNSVEELEASAEKARSAYKKYNKGGKKKDEQTEDEDEDEDEEPKKRTSNKRSPEPKPRPKPQVVINPMSSPQAYKQMLNRK